jgi:hypothetical protein
MDAIVATNPIEVNEIQQDAAKKFSGFCSKRARLAHLFSDRKNEVKTAAKCENFDRKNCKMRYAG